MYQKKYRIPQRVLRTIILIFYILQNILLEINIDNNKDFIINIKRKKGRLESFLSNSPYKFEWMMDFFALRMDI